MRKLALLLCLVLAMAACAPAMASAYTPGTYTGTAAGFGGDVTVTVTVDENAITDVQITGDAETPGVGSMAVEGMPQQILDAQNAEVEGVAGATFTSAAVRDALNAALREASGEALAAAEMADGSYTATVPSYAEMYGLATTGSMTMTTVIKDNRIADITIDEFTDTDIIGGMAFPILTEQVLGTQSLGVDTVAGATVSSNAFLAGLADCVKQAGGSVEALRAVPVEKRASQAVEYDADVVVIGAGMAGLCAATQAAEDGANVILLERNKIYSSSTTRSLGFVVGADTPLQKAEGIEDTEDAFYADICALYEGEKELDTGLLRVMADNSSDLNAWLSEHGVEFTGVIRKSAKGPRATKRIHTTAGGSALTSALVGAVEKAGATVLLGTPALSLIQEDGVVTGVKATNENGDDITIRAQATIVCAGSYTNDPELSAKLNPRINNIAYLCGCGDGDAYRWFEAAGAEMINIPYTQFMYYSYAPSFVNFPEVIPNSPDNAVYDILLVTPAGERVTAEDNFCFEFTKENWNRGFDEGYCVVDQEFADKYPVLMDDVLNNVVPSSGLPFGYKADTLEELAACVGMDGAALSATVARYNELCDKGVDEDFGKDAEYMNKLEGPYYIIRLPMITTDGYSGAKVNGAGQVLDAEGNWIQGLYGAGSCAVSQTVSVNYFGCGTSLLTCGVFGREAAKDAVSRLAK